MITFSVNGATTNDRIDQDDVVFVSFPTWGMQLPPPMKSFLRQYGLRGKTVVLFNTNDGYGTGRSVQTVKELCPQSTVEDGFATRGGRDRDGRSPDIQGARAAQVKNDVKSWLRKLDETLARTSSLRTAVAQ